MEFDKEYDWPLEHHCDKCDPDYKESNRVYLTLDKLRSNHWLAYYSGPCRHRDTVIRETPEERLAAIQRKEDYYSRIGVRRRVDLVWEGDEIVGEKAYVEDFWRGITVHTKDDLDAMVQQGLLGWSRKYIERDDEICFADMTDLVLA